MKANAMISTQISPMYSQLEPVPKPIYAAPESRGATAMLSALYGGGNARVSDDLIQAYVAAPGRTAQEVLDAAVTYGISADQLSKAMEGHDAYTPQQIQAYLASFGLDRTTLIKAVVSNWSEANFDQTLLSLGEQGQALTDLDQALASSYDGVAPLMAQADSAHAQAARLQGQYEALAVQVDRGMAEYERLTQELEAAHALKARAQTDLEAGQAALKSVVHIDQKRDRRATVQVNAEYQVEAARQRLTQAQMRIDQASSAIETLKQWGLPLMAQKEAAQAAWRHAATLATDAVEVSNAQLARVAQLAQERNTVLAEMTLDHDRLLAYVSAHPDWVLAEQVRESIQASVMALKQTQDSHRAWVDEVVARGLAQDDDATDLEARAWAFAGALNLDEFMRARSQAEIKLNEAQAEFDAASAALNKAQLDLDAAYQARMEANDAGGKTARTRGRDQADRQKILAADVLMQAQQRFEAAQINLNQVQAQTIPVIERALKAQAQWVPLNTRALAARHQVDSHLGVAALASSLEHAVQSAIAAAQIQLIGIGQTKVLAAQQLAAQNQLSSETLVAIEKSVRIDLEDAIGSLQHVESVQAQDRRADMQFRARWVQRQAQASGRALIADNLMNDAQGLGQAVAQLDVSGLKTQVAQAKEQLSAANARDVMADMYMDWAEARTQAKKQARDIKAAAPELTAAQAQRDEARQTYDALVAQLAAARVMEEPIKEAAQLASFRALSALQDAQDASREADNAAAWSALAQRRYQGSDTVSATAQIGVIEGSRSLARLQALWAGSQTDEHVAEQMRSEATRTQVWADEYAHHVVQRRRAQADTQANQRALDTLTIEAQATELWHAFLGSKENQVRQVYQNLKDSVLPQQEALFAHANEQARQQEQTALAAYQRMVHQEGVVGLAYIANRQEISSVAAQPEEPHAVVNAWLEKELARRQKSTRKQLHLLDDWEQWKNSDSQLQSVRHMALQTAQAAQDAGLNAAYLGQRAHAQSVAVMMEGQRLEQTQALWVHTGAQLAQLHGQAKNQADQLAQALEAEQGAHAQALHSLSQHIEDSAVHAQHDRVMATDARAPHAPFLTAQAQALESLGQAYQGLAQNAQSMVDWLDSVGHSVAQAHADWQASQAGWQARAQERDSAVQADWAALEADRAALRVRAEDQKKSLSELYQRTVLAQLAVRAHATRQEYVEDVHERRARLDRVHKKRKKKGLFATLMNVAALVASAAITYFAPPLGATLGGQFLASAAVGSAINAGAQGVNIAAGWQDAFDLKPMVAMGGMAVFGSVMGTVTTTLDKAFQGTLLGSEVAASAAAQAIPAGAFNWLGTAMSWSAGATAGSLAKQAFEMMTGQANTLRWDTVHLDAVRQAIGGVFRIHVGSSWAGNPFTFTNYRPMSVPQMVTDVAQRVAGTFVTNVVLKNAGMLDEIRIGDLVAVGAARGAQMWLRDVMGTLPIAANSEPGAWVSTGLGQSIIRTATLAVSAALQSAYGASVDWDTLLYRGIGRVTGQYGSLLGQAQVQNMLTGADS